MKGIDPAISEPVFEVTYQVFRLQPDGSIKWEEPQTALGYRVEEEVSQENEEGIYVGDQDSLRSFISHYIDKLKNNT